MERGVVIRAAGSADDTLLLGLNNAAVPHVNALTPEQLAWIREAADYARIAERDGLPVGFVFAIRNGTPYWSANYAWFGERYDAFLYLDRVVVAAQERRSGVGRALYDDLMAFVRGRWSRITLEVNVRPPNPASMVFHESLGFRRVGSRTYDGSEVAMLELPIRASSSPSGASSPTDCP